MNTFLVQVCPMWYLEHNYTGGKMCCLSKIQHSSLAGHPLVLFGKSGNLIRTLPILDFALNSPRNPFLHSFFSWQSLSPSPRLLSWNYNCTFFYFTKWRFLKDRDDILPCSPLHSWLAHKYLMMYRKKQRKGWRGGREERSEVISQWSLRKN